MNFMLIYISICLELLGNSKFKNQKADNVQLDWSMNQMQIKW